MELKSKYNEKDLRLAAIFEGLLPEGADMTDEIRDIAAKKLDFIGWAKIKKDAD